MKKLLVAGLSVVTLLSTVSATETHMDMHTDTTTAPEKITTCTIVFSQDESSSLERLANFLYTRSDLLAEKFPGTKKMTLEFADKLYNSLYYNCATDHFENYKMFQAGFSEYISKLLIFKDLDLYEYTPDPEAEKAVLQLQQHVIDLLAFGFDRTRPAKSTSTMHMDFNLDTDIMGQGIDLDVNVDASSDSKYDMKENLVQSHIIVDGSINGQTNNPLGTSNIAATVNLDMDTLQTNNGVYIKPNNLKIDVDTTEMGTFEAMQVAMVNSMIDQALTKIDGRYVNLSSGMQDELTEFSPGVIMKPYVIFHDLYQLPVMEFYKDGDSWYGKLNTNVCDIANSAGIPNTQDCEDMIQDMNIASQGKGYLMMQKDGLEYSLGFTDRFTQDKIPETLDLEKLVKRNNNEISYLSIPLDEDDAHNQISYQDDEFHIHYEDENGSTHFKGNPNGEQKDFVIKISIYEENLDIDGVISYKKEGDKHTMTMSAVIYQNDEEIGALNLESEEVIEYLQSLELNEPQDAVSIRDLEEIFSEISY